MLVRILWLLVMSMFLYKTNTTPVEETDNNDMPEEAVLGLVESTDNGHAYNEDQIDGQAYEEYQGLLREISRHHAQQVGDHDHEAVIQSEEAAYMDWIHEYQETGVLLERSEAVKLFMSNNGITMEDVYELYGPHDANSTGPDVRQKRSSPFVSPENGDRRTHSRGKRSFLELGTGIWPKCIVPYTIYNLTSKVAHMIKNVHRHYEKYTGFRFVEFEGIATKEKYGLNHTNHLIYVDNGDSCWSYIGNMWAKGQEVAPCAEPDVAIHELGHAFGMHHEQTNPLSFPYIQVRWKNIQPDLKSQYYMGDIASLYNKNGFYDISSTMHYGKDFFNLYDERTMASYDPDYDYLIGTKNDFYMFKDMQEYHQCYNQYPSCQTWPQCYNGGYVSVMDGKCACRCPPELDPATGCKSKIKYGEVKWPEGQYTFLKVAGSPCPSGFGTGTMVHLSIQNITHSKTYSHSPIPINNELGHDVCTKTNTESCDPVWGPGSYCILKFRNECPAGFHEGYQAFYGPFKTSNISAGVVPSCNHSNPYENLPDGNHSNPYENLPGGNHSNPYEYLPGSNHSNPYEYLPHGNHSNPYEYLPGGNHSNPYEYLPHGNHSNPYEYLPAGYHSNPFEYIYCCRDDGLTKNPIRLPRTSSFILYVVDSNGCQQVEGMSASWEYFGVASDPEQGLVESGALPAMYKVNNYTRNIFYCVYRPLDKDCGMLKEFEDYETSFTFSSPGYPNKYPNGLDCFWHFISPKGTKMQLDFTEFEVSGPDTTKCNDHLEIAFTKPTMSGFKTCGHGYKKTTWTWDNFLSVKFTTLYGDTYKGFNATITIYKDSDLCYNGDGSDRSYAGNVNYAKSFKQCIPWSKATNCMFGKFSSKVIDWQLSGNECRNVELGTQPWCYTNAETCERQNCDVCNWGSCYDRYLDCPSQIEKDSSFCDNNQLGQAHYGCMESCGFCEKRERVVKQNCSAPPDIEGITASPAQNTYTVGSVVTYLCLTSKEYRTSTCTTEGNWTYINFVCGSCPSGFSVFQKRCFKWLGYKIQTDFHTALQLCSKLNSVPVKVDSLTVSKFVMSLVEYTLDDNKAIWLGIDFDQNDVPYWADHTETAVGWTNWRPGEPDRANNHNCVRLEHDSLWDDTYCDKLLDVVCEYQFTTNDTEICKDQSDDCEADIAETPDLCSKYPDYAWHNCRNTCGVGSCRSENTCIDDTVGEPGTRIAGGDYMLPGEYLEYECNSGYVVGTGDVKRGCLNSGKLAGAPLKCIGIDHVSHIDLFKDKEIFHRAKWGTWDHWFVANVSDMRFTIAGNVTSWTYFSNYRGLIAFGVWRFYTDISKQYEPKLVGLNIITNGPNERGAVYNVPVPEQVYAEVGDVIGIYQYNTELSYTMCDKTLQPQHAGWLTTKTAESDPRNFQAGPDYEFVEAKVDCRIYSIRASVDPSAAG